MNKRTTAEPVGDLQPVAGNGFPDWRLFLKAGRTFGVATLAAH
jgi:hypothetical protein